MVYDNKCLWCGKQLDNGNFFCIGGGPTREFSHTDPNTKITKSYCFDSFLATRKVLNRLVPMSETRQAYDLYKDEIKAWYKSIPYILYSYVPTKKVESMVRNTSIVPTEKVSEE